MSKTQTIEHDPQPKGQAVAATGSTAVTPMDMLDRALSSGATPETLERLMALQERYEKSQARKAFDNATAAAKAKIRPIVRNATGHNSKKYVSLDAIARTADPILAEHGLCYRYRTEQSDRITVTCILFGHGHSEESTLSGPPDTTGNKNAIQAIGSTLTYLQRYALMQILGLAASDDDDGNGGAGTKGPITPDQAEQITKLIQETKTKIDDFLNWAEAPSVSDMPSSKYTDAIKMFDAKKAKQAKGART